MSRNSANVLTRSSSSPDQIVVPDAFAIAFDEDPSEVQPHLDPDVNPRKLLDLASELSDKIPEQSYIDLCNLSNDWARVERRMCRMREWILHNEGSDCSALLPSDDNDGGNNDNDDLEWDEHDEYDDCTSHDPCDGEELHGSECSTDESDYAQVANETEKEANRRKINLECEQSGFVIKSYGQYYSIPDSAMMRGSGDPLTVSMRSFERLTHRGKRALEWEDLFPNSTVDTSKIVVLKMRSRTKDGFLHSKIDYYWGVVLDVEEEEEGDECDEPKQLRKRVVTLLPETTCWGIAKRPQNQQSSLVKRYLPFFMTRSSLITNYTRFLCSRFRDVPVAGPSRVDRDASVKFRGNHWSVVNV